MSTAARRQKTCEVVGGRAYAICKRWYSQEGSKKHVLFLLPLRGYKAPLGLWCRRQRHDLLVITKPIDLWLVWVDLLDTTARPDLERCSKKAHHREGCNNAGFTSHLLDFRLTRFHKLCLIIETSDGTDRCESSSVKLGQNANAQQNVNTPGMHMHTPASSALRLQTNEIPRSLSHHRIL